MDEGYTEDALCCGFCLEDVSDCMQQRKAGMLKAQSEETQPYQAQLYNAAIDEAVLRLEACGWYRKTPYLSVLPPS